MARLFGDTVGFSAAKIIRRILGLAHNIDFELIEDPALAGGLRGAQPAAGAGDDGGHGRFHDRRVTMAAPNGRDWQPDFAWEAAADARLQSFRDLVSGRMRP